MSAATPHLPPLQNRAPGIDGDALLRHVLDTLGGGVFTVDREGHITSWNRAMEDITGYTAGDVLQQPCSVLQGDSCFGGPCCPTEHQCQVFADGRVLDKRCHLRRRDGRDVTVLKNARIMKGSDGRVLGAIESLTDISGVVALEAQVANLREQVAGRARYEGLVGRHPSMQRLYDVVELAASSQSSVLIEGETGTGKELVAAAIHEKSRRRDGPFVRVSCAALSENLLESELFGHVRGAFTGAVADRIGRFEAADGGTIFLDEIGDISPAVQTKLLRVLQERAFERVGEVRSREVDIRIIAATNKNLRELADRGLFREDLYYRLSVIPVHVPPLRERASDIPLLAEHFVDHLNRSLYRQLKGVAPDAMRRLTAYHWPGNVRELEHAIEYGFVVSRSNELEEDGLPPPILAATAASPGPQRPRRRRGPPDAAELRRVLKAHKGNRTRAAESLGVSRVTLWKWLKALEIDADAVN